MTRTPERVRVVSANVRNNPIMRRWKVEEDYRSIRKSGADIIGWQEIGSRRPWYKALIPMVFSLFVWRHVLLGRTPTPISFRRDRYQLLDKGVVLLHDGKAGASPRRRMVWVKLRRRSDGLVFIVSNRHYVSGAWNDKPKRHKAWRRRAWNAGWRVDRQHAVGWHREGLLHIGTGDFNRKDVRPFCSSHEWVDNRGIDKVFVCDPRDSVTTWTRRRGPLHSDHDKRVATLEVAALVVEEPARPDPKPLTNLTITQRVVRNARRRGLTVLDHDAWGSQQKDVYAERRKVKPALVPADTLVQHITVTLDTGPLTGDFATDMRTVERIGMERFGSGVSYNFVVDMSTGMVGVGQPLDAKGTHTVNNKGVSGFSFDQNYWARAIAVLGMERTPLSAAAEDSIAVMFAAMVDEGALTSDPDYCPHSMFAYKDCPCDATRDRMPAIRNRALALV